MCHVAWHGFEKVRRFEVIINIKILIMSEEGTPIIDMFDKMTPEQQAAAKKAFQKQQSVDRTAYKKALREGNDLKKLQVEELELNVRYYNSKREWLDLRDKVNALDAEERAIMQEENRKRAELIEKEEALKVEEEKPDIVIPEMGKAREE